MPQLCIRPGQRAKLLNDRDYLPNNPINVPKALFSRNARNLTVVLDYAHVLQQVTDSSDELVEVAAARVIVRWFLRSRIRELNEQLNGATYHFRVAELREQLLLSIRNIGAVVAVRFTIEPVACLRDTRNPRAFWHWPAEDCELHAHLSAAL